MATTKRTVKKKNKRTPRGGKPAHGSKSEFVRMHPDTPAAELSVLAKKQGFKLPVGHIYNVRAIDRKKAAANGSGKRGPTARFNGSDGSNDDQLHALVLRMGLDRADAVFTSLRAEMTKLSAR